MNGKEITLAQARLHPAIFLLPLLPMVGLFVLSLAVLFPMYNARRILSQLNPQSAQSVGSLFYFLLFVPEITIGLASLLPIWAAYAKSNITLTNRRLMFRTGLFLRVSGELPLANVDAILLVEPFLGRSLGYGTVIATSVGGLRFPLRFLASAKSFHALLQKAVLDAKSPCTGIPTATNPPAPNDDSRYMPKS